jgi:hypothetical protein
MNFFQRFVRWFSTPQTSKEINPRNFINVQIDAIGVGISGAAAAFPSYVLTRLNASTAEIGLLTSMPGLTGLLLSIPLGQFLQRQKNIVPWFSFARLLVISSYALTGLVLFLDPGRPAIISILLVWALATIPQTILSISFSVVMNAIAGPKGRYELMTRRWSILSLTTVVTSICVTQVIDRLSFPQNYQIVFLILSIGGLVSYYFSSHLNISDVQPEKMHGHNWRERISDYIHLITKEKPFLSFTLKRFVFLTGTTLVAPLYPVFFIRHLHARDSWLTTMGIIQTLIVAIGYFFWIRQSRIRGSRFVLLTSTLGTCFFPILVSTTTQFWPVWIFAGINAIFSAGLNLVFFDELMKTVPTQYSATFVAAAQSIQYISAILAPTLGTLLSDTFGFQSAFLISSGLSFLGFLLFALEKQRD